MSEIMSLIDVFSDKFEKTEPGTAITSRLYPLAISAVIIAPPYFGDSMTIVA